MKFHKKLLAMFTRHELTHIIKKSAIHFTNKDGEIYGIILDTDNIYAELYADSTQNETALIMNFNEGLISPERFRVLFQKSVKFNTMDVWHTD